MYHFDSILSSSITTLYAFKDLEKGRKSHKTQQSMDFAPRKLYSFAGKSGQSPFASTDDSCAIKLKA